MNKSDENCVENDHARSANGDFLNILDDFAHGAKRESSAASHLTKVKSIIASKNSHTIPLIVCTERSLQSEIFWDICTAVCEKLTQKVFEEDEGMLDACERCLHYLVKEGNQKEVFYALVEQLRAVRDQLAYRIMSTQAVAVLNNMTEKQRNLSCETLIQSASIYVNSLELPNANLNLEGDERKLVANDPKVRSIGDSLEVYLDAMTVFMNDTVVAGNVSGIILQRLFDVLDQQLVLIHIGYNDVDNSRTPSGYCHYVAESLLNHLSKLYPDFYKLLLELNRKNELTAAESNKCADDWSEVVMGYTYSGLSIGCFLYLTLGELMNTDNWPSVLSHLNVFQISLPFMVALLKRTEDLVVYKGIYLAEALIRKFARHSLESSILDEIQFAELSEVFINIMLHCNVQEYRQRCLKLLEDYIQRYKPSGRYKLYRHITKSVTHAGVLGHMIGLIKEEINHELLRASPDTHFVGECLQNLLVPVLGLPDGITTDLLTESDRIIAGLNLIRYLSIRDPPGEDKTGFWRCSGVIESLFLEPLKDSLKHSRANYITELELAMEKKRSRRKDEQEVEVRVGTTVVPPMLQGRHMEIMEGALGMFDLIESLHARVAQLIDVNKKNYFGEQITLAKLA